MQYLYIISVLLIFLTACNQTNSENKKKLATPLSGSEVQLQIAAADSIWNERMGTDGGFVGIHSHGKDLAVHAHQDIGKSRRILRESYRLLPEREKSYSSEVDQRKKILLEMGLLKTEKQDS